MEILFSILLLVFLLLFYLSNRSNKINKWFAIGVFTSWFGVFKEAVLYNIIPYLEAVFKNYTLADRFVPAYSVMTWVLYSLTMPTMIIFALYFCNTDVTHPRLLRYVKAFIYVPAIALSFVFPPLTFRFYQLNSQAFVLAYSAYNLSLGAIYTFLMIRGVRLEKPGKSKAQKKYVCIIALVPIIYWLLSASVPYLFGLDNLFKLWQGNAIILLICLIGFMVLAFKTDGFMGLRLTGETYNWTSDMSIVSKGASYTGHMLKNQTSKMEWCIENLKAQYNALDVPEELAILSRSIATIKSYVEQIKKHSDNIVLLEEVCNLRSMLDDALSFSVKAFKDTVATQVSIPDGVLWMCDKNHMTEVFINIISNAAEAAQGLDMIEISGGFDRGGRTYLLNFTDKGAGMSEDELKNMFVPYFTTKNTERNFGLGLAYCKNVVEKHGGNIKAASAPNAGTSVTISLPAKRVSVRGNSEAGNRVCLKK